MTSKKTYSIILTTLISLSLASTVYAQEPNKSTSNQVNAGIATSSIAKDANSNISKDEAKDIAKKVLKDYFDTSIDDTKFQTNVNFTPDYAYGANSKNYVWQISWSSHDQEKDVNINVSLDAATGKVVNTDLMTYLHGQAPGIANLTEDQAKEIGKNFLNKINPQEISQCKLLNNDDINYNFKGDPTAYNFYYCRIVNGIPFLGNYLNVSVDSITGKIRSYAFRWNNSQFPSQDNIITQDRANEIFKDNIKLDPKYIPYRDEYGYNNETNPTILAYMADTSGGVSIDAKDGRILSYDNTASVDKKVKDLDENQKKDFISSYRPIQKLDKELTSDSAEVIMKDIVKELYGEGYDIGSINYQDYKGGYGPTSNCWSGNFTKKDSKNGFEDQGQVTIDSFTGQLMSINRYNPMDKFGINNNGSKPKLNWEQAYDKAIGTIKKYFPDKIKDINTEQTYIKRIEYYNNELQIDRYYGFNFSRQINGIAYQDNTINISIDAMTGELNNIDCRWTQNINVPSANGSISKDEAQGIFFKKYVPQLQYTLTNTSNNPKNPTMGVKLVYSLLDGLQYRQFYGIEAFNGKFIDYNGKEIDTNFEAFKEKIKGSPIEKELNILASLGIIDTKNFDFNKQITRAELIKMLVNAKGYRPYMLDSAPSLKINYSGSKTDETYKYLQMAVSYGILDNSGDFKGDEKVTREEMVKDIVKLLGYNKLAQAKEIFVLSYSDAGNIAPENTGYVAIAKGLGLININDNNFRPKDQAIVSDAAVAIYKALNSLRSNGY